MGSRLTGGGVEEVYKAAEFWVEQALRRDDSVFTPGERIWSKEYLAELREHYLDQPLGGDRRFLVKLGEQLEGASDQAHQLIAEVMYVHQLISKGHIKFARKKQLIEDILGWGAPIRAMPDDVARGLESGIATNQAMNRYRPFQIAFILEFTEQWKALETTEQQHLLSNPWDFKQFVTGLQFTGRHFSNGSGHANPQREAILHLVHPDTFEAILTPSTKSWIVRQAVAKSLLDETSDNIDRDLKQVRMQLEGEFGSNLTFFDDAVTQYLQADDSPPPPPPPPPPDTKYTIGSIIEDGCFVSRSQLEQALERLKTKQNLILQGPPGTGKTWLAKRLAYALIGHEDETREFVRPVQFHANMSYEDFVRGYRPTSSDGGDAKLELMDGPFMQLIDDAKNDESNAYVMVIEEINRGNPAQIFGEMLTLLEADKRNEREALSLAYPKCEGERVHIPKNVHVIGTMNLADRSLALVDFALRRRFAFLDLEPTFGDEWQEWCQKNCEADEEFLRDIQQRMNALNEAIAADSSLGKQFCVGHSVVTPAPETPMNAEWFKGVVDTEIRPLLAEYWFDAGGATTVQEHIARLEEGL